MTKSVLIVATLGAVVLQGCLVGTGRYRARGPVAPGVDVDVNVELDYVYFPEHHAYWCESTRFWWVINGGVWVHTQIRPPHIIITHDTPWVVFNIRGPGPQALFEVHAKRYPAHWRPDRPKGPPPGRGWDRRDGGRDDDQRAGNDRRDDDRRRKDSQRAEEEKRAIDSKRAEEKRREEKERRSADEKRAEREKKAAEQERDAKEKRAVEKKRADDRKHAEDRKRADEKKRDDDAKERKDDKRKKDNKDEKDDKRDKDEKDHGKDPKGLPA